MANRHTRRKKHRIDQNMPKGELKRVEDFLPPPFELSEVVDELNNKDLRKTIAEGRCAIRRYGEGISLSSSLEKRKKFHSASA